MSVYIVRNDEFCGEYRNVSSKAGLEHAVREQSHQPNFVLRRGCIILTDTSFEQWQEEQTQIYLCLSTPEMEDRPSDDLPLQPSRKKR